MKSYIETDPNGTFKVSEAKIEEKRQMAANDISKVLVAIESTSYILDNLKYGQEKISRLLDPVRAQMNQSEEDIKVLISKCELICEQLKDLALLSVFREMFKNENLFQSMIPTTRWDIKESVAEQTNQQIVERFAYLLKDSKERLWGYPLPEFYLQEITSKLVRFMVRSFMDAVSRVKKCSVQGRVLMLNDIKAILKTCQEETRGHAVRLAELLPPVETFVSVWNANAEDIKAFILRTMTKNPLKYNRSLLASPQVDLLKKAARRELMVSIVREHKNFILEVVQNQLEIPPKYLSV
jgi:hypothetical protein